MTPLYFFGDGRLPSNGFAKGHYVYRPSGEGGVVCLHESEPEELRDWKQVLPHVPFDPGDPSQRCPGLAVGEGQGMGVALYQRVAGWSVLAMWDRTGDARGNSVALFYVRGDVGMVPLLRRVQQEFPELWARIANPRPVMLQRGSPDPEETLGVPIDEAMPGLWEKVQGRFANAELPQDTVLAEAKTLRGVSTAPGR